MARQWIPQPIRLQRLLAVLVGLLAAQAAPAQDGARGEGLVGYEIIDPQRSAIPDGVPELGVPARMRYYAARDVIDTRDACLQGAPDLRERIERAYRQLSTTQVKHVAARQWQALAAAVEANGDAPPARTRTDCARLVSLANGFDAYLDTLLVAQADIALAAAAAPDDRPEGMRAMLGVTMEAGTLIEEVVVDSPAHRAGLRSHDRVLAVDGTPVTTVLAIGRVLRKYEPEDRVAVTVRRFEGGLTEGAASQVFERELTFDVPLVALSVMRGR
ncbi:hypothetical protein C1924_03200 [Stenotrophomonas sp. ESTM1D_MKCIP4_1]|uniref:PDZ domain-containing protein n=1 Tax=Stenotrophomonas sp. ESTM1D_MKCIP4_1 TaxID=2072414 RepID=UPI000D5402B6|nr:PDZ domain-containing protein [Stenotrophomonas sp. ESTM1D_MKCIP4_1]AWH52267.1 hypothetical protein C1924_03200 [Stenotrophomonas sp. ESTM1D_MKCIP4_1]